MMGGRGLDAVKAATWDLHTRAERGGIIAEIMAGRASRLGVALLLRNLLPVYQVLDGSRFGVPALARSAAIEADLLVLWPDVELPLLAEGRAYAERVELAVRGDGSALIAHAYVRYLGDLNGGRIMRRRLVACLGDLAGGLTVHEYPMLRDKDAFTRAYREELDAAVRAAEFELVVQEAMAAFEMNIALSEALEGQRAACVSPLA
jgi:heme oxygenase (biliverdin-producing, ferredoxin)